jgi:ABC-type Fe3+ transport system substrate-binding protein
MNGKTQNSKRKTPNRPRGIRYRSRLLSFVLCVLSFFPLLLAACGRQTPTQAAKDALSLYILSPHGNDIRREFTEAFSDWHQRHFGQPVRIEWPDIGGGGTGNILTFLDKAYQSSDSSGNDLMFGGGSEAFILLASHGYLVPPPPMSDADRTVWTTDPIDEVPAGIFGSGFHGKDGAWVAAAMSSFGMVVNKERAAELHVPLPQTWEDLAGPAWIGRVSLSDPSKSGSVLTSYDMILQQYGWEKGWEVLMRIFCNTSLIRESGPDSAGDVGSADAMAGIVIDFYGRIHINRAGPSIMTYIIPQGGTSLDPDPIAMLKGAPHAQLAARFMRFVVSPDGQRLWVFKSGVPGGPKKAVLGRMSILPALYEKESASMLDPKNPFTGAKPLTVDSKTRGLQTKFLGHLVKAALIDNFDAMIAARKAIHDAGDPPDLLERLTPPPNFVPTSLNSKGELDYGPERPVKDADQAALAAEFAPTGEKAAFAERLQTGLRNLWRREFAERFEELYREARSRRTKP